MFVLLRLFHDYLQMKNKWGNNKLVFWFFRLRYKIEVRIMIHKYILKPNDILGLRELIVEYVSFLSVLKNLTGFQEHLPGSINTGTIYHVIYSDEEKSIVKTVEYTHKINENSRVRIYIDQSKNVIDMNIHSPSGYVAFSYKSLISADLIGVKNSVEQLTRKDIADTVSYYLLYWGEENEHF